MISPRLLQAVGHPQRLRVLGELKCTPAGLPVRTLAERLGLSYMGAKETCLKLAEQGLLETWRDPQPNGRPRQLYRVAPRTHALFAESGPTLTLEVLEAAHRLFGAAAPEKLLRLAWQQQAEALAARIPVGSTVLQRAEKLAHLRTAEGCFSSVHPVSIEEAAVVEYHAPCLPLLRAYSLVAKLEAELFQRVLNVPVVREECAVAGQFQATFTFCIL